MADRVDRIDSYIVKVYGPIEVESGISAPVWNDLKSKYAGTFNIRIPHFDGDTQDIQAIEYVFNNRQIIRYYGLIVTDEYDVLNDTVPFGYYNGPRYGYKPLDSMNAAFYCNRYCPSDYVSDLIGLKSLNTYKYYHYAITTDNSDYYCWLRLNPYHYSDSERWIDELHQVPSYRVVRKSDNYAIPDVQCQIPGGYSGESYDYMINDATPHFVFTYGNDEWYQFDFVTEPLYLVTNANRYGVVTAADIQYTKDILGTPIVINNVDPYEPIPHDDDDPEGGGGEGDFDDIPVPRSSLPTISAADTGFTRLFNPSLSQLQSLAAYMWTDTTFWDTLKNHFLQMLEDPMKYIIALNLVPCSVPNGSSQEVKLLFIPTGVYMPSVTNQFVDVDCGTCTVPKQFNTAMDYSPYTKVSCYLPFIGTVQLDADEVVGNELHIWYRIDVFSGGCVADIVMNGGVRYSYAGQCAINVPFSSADFTGYIAAMLQAAKSVASIGAGAAGQGAVAATLAGMPEPKTSKQGGNVTTTNYDKDYNFKGASVKEYDLEKTTTQASFDSIIAQNINNTVGAVMGSKPNIQRSGGYSGNTGYLGVRRPYLIIESPKLVNPSSYGKYNGYPSMKYLNFSSLVGFTQVQQVQLTGFGATNPELDEIMSLLKSGVIF